MIQVMKGVSVGASLLLLAGAPALAEARGGGAGGADPSGATRWTSGREDARPEARNTAGEASAASAVAEGGTGSARDQAGEGSPTYRGDLGGAAATAGSAQDDGFGRPLSTGGGR